MSEPVQRIGEPLRSAKAARPQRSEARSARPRQSVYQGLGQAVPGRAERRTISNPAPSKRLLHRSSRDPCAVNQTAAVAQHLPPPRPRNKKSPRRGTNATSPGTFWSRHRLAVGTLIIPHRPRLRQSPHHLARGGPSPRGGRWEGLSLAPALSTSAALRSKPPTTQAQQKIAARQLTKEWKRCKLMVVRPFR